MKTLIILLTVIVSAHANTDDSYVAHLACGNNNKPTEYIILRVLSSNAKAATAEAGAHGCRAKAEYRSSQDARLISFTTSAGEMKENLGLRQSISFKKNVSDTSCFCELVLIDESNPKLESKCESKIQNFSKEEGVEYLSSELAARRLKYTQSWSSYSRTWESELRLVDQVSVRYRKPDGSVKRNRVEFISGTCYKHFDNPYTNFSDAEENDL